MLFRRDKGKDAAAPAAPQVLATIERVYVAGAGQVNYRTHLIAYVDLWLRLCFPGRDSAPVTCDVAIRSIESTVPVPGQRIRVTEDPSARGGLRLDVDDLRNGRHRLHLGPLDPGVPRGWGAGIFAVEPWEHRSREPDAELARERELFRAGTPQRATVVASVGHGFGFTLFSPFLISELTLAVGGAQHTLKRRFPGKSAPQIGDELLAVVAPDGSLALDHDERFDGPPAHALVFTTPAAVAAERAKPPTQVQSEQIQAMYGGEMATARLDGTLDSLRRMVETNKRFSREDYESSVRDLLRGARAAGTIDEAGEAARLAAAGIYD